MNGAVIEVQSQEIESAGADPVWARIRTEARAAIEKEAAPRRADSHQLVAPCILGVRIGLQDVCQTCFPRDVGTNPARNRG